MKIIDLGYIKERRNEKKVTLQKMANRLGFKNASTYLKYENGEYAFKAVHLPIIAKTLECRMDELFFENNFAETAKCKF